LFLSQRWGGDKEEIMDEEEKDLEIKYSALGGRESPGTASSRGANDMPKKKKKL